MTATAIHDGVAIDEAAAVRRLRDWSAAGADVAVVIEMPGGEYVATSGRLARPSHILDDLELWPGHETLTLRSLRLRRWAQAGVIYRETVREWQPGEVLFVDSGRVVSSLEAQASGGRVRVYRLVPRPVEGA